jgi:hypothetical protein
MEESDVSLLRKQQSRLVPAQAGTQETWIFTPFWIPACAGMTQAPPSPGGAEGTAGLSRKGERPIASWG